MVVVDENVAELDVSVRDSQRVQVVKSLEQSLHYLLDGF